MKAMLFDKIEKDYKRIDILSEANLVNYYASCLARSSDFDEKNTLIREVDIIKRRYHSFKEYVFVKFSQDASDEFFKNEFSYILSNEDEFKKATIKFALTLLEDDDIERLKKRWGKYYFDKLSIMQDLYKKDVVGLNMNENKILQEINEYRNTKSISFDGEIITNKTLAKFLLSNDRNQRKRLFEEMNKSNLERNNYYAQKYKDLVIMRYKIAKRLGYNNYLDYSDKERCRINYNHNDIVKFREAIKKHLATNANVIADIKKEKLGVDQIYTYDLKVYFKDYNAMPIKDPYLLLEKIANKLEEYNPFLSKIIRKIINDKSLDLLPRKNKATYSFATNIYNHDITFMFANYEADLLSFSNFITCLSYALILYIGSYNELIEYIEPQDDIINAYSTAFSFIILSFADELFENGAKNYMISYKINLLFDILFYCLINEFEELMYLNINTDLEERYEIFRKLHKEYFPFISVDEKVFDVGMWWLNYHTLFNTPMLSINYAIGDLSGIDFYNNLLEDKEEAFKNVTLLMDNASKEDFLTSIELSGLKNPFKEENIKDIITKYIDSIAKEYKKI